MQTNVFGVLLDAKDLFSYQLFTFFELSPNLFFSIRFSVHYSTWNISFLLIDNITQLKVNYDDMV